jgi:SAM-dependent methyltransferase
VRLDDPALVQAEYQSEAGLAARSSIYANAEGPDARELAFEAVAEVRPRRVLEAGCGPGEFAERIASELGAEVVAVDISPRMVELARRRGLDARCGDVQALRFAAGEFDCAIANWMLYHVPDLFRGVAELARVLRPGGRLVAATNGCDHLRELWELVGGRPVDSTFNAENGEAILRRSFARVERRDATGWVTFPERADAERYLKAMAALAGPAKLPRFEGPLRARRTPYVFVAEKAA